MQNLGYGENILTIINKNFADIDQISKEHGLFDFVLADLGVSSMQIDNPQRGFSYKNDGPLDLRLNPLKGVSAAERLKELSVQELEGMLAQNADEPYAKEISRQIIYNRKNGKSIETTTQLRDIIGSALSFLPKDIKQEAVKKTCQRTFQALRIDVNSEFEVLETFLNKLPSIMEKGGRIVILTFHSGEDRLVKKSFKQFFKEGLYSDIATDVIRPSMEECTQNSRARSTKMRWAVKS